MPCLVGAGAMDAQATAAMAGHVNGVDSEKRKRTRGAKPKYQFLTAEEAIAHRCTFPRSCSVFSGNISGSFQVLPVPA